MRALVYLRQSLDRTGLGAAVDRQREDCLKLCEERGWEVVGTFVDNDVSASSAKPRPSYTRMLEAVSRGEAEIVVAWHVDRLTRKITDLESLIELAQRTGLRIATVTGDLDLSTDAGRLVGRILASVARGEVERKGARQKRAQQQAAQQGRPAGGRRAFGYDSKGMTINEAEAKHVRAAFSEVLRGASLKGIARDWNERGLATTAGNPWRHDNVREVLKNPRYAGLRAYRGEVVGPAVWPALIDGETHAAAAALLSLPERRTTATTARKYLLPGLALCWKCGSDVATGHTRHGKRVYVCRAHKCISRKAGPVDELVQAVMVERLSRLDALDLLTTQDGPDLTAKRAQAQAIRDRLDDLATGLEEGILTLAAVRRSSDRLRAEIEAVETQINDGTHADVLTSIVTAADVRTAWVAADLQQKRAAVDALMVVTLLKPERGTREFDPESVRIEWRC
ncbi:MAG: recombinase family protein [Nocardioidaceae bacterium]